jgi:hypothetical protein
LYPEATSRSELRLLLLSATGVTEPASPRTREPAIIYFR